MSSVVKSWALESALVQRLHSLCSFTIYTEWLSQQMSWKCHNFGYFLLLTCLLLAFHYWPRQKNLERWEENYLWPPKAKSWTPWGRLSRDTENSRSQVGGRRSVWAWGRLPPPGGARTSLSTGVHGPVLLHLPSFLSLFVWGRNPGQGHSPGGFHEVIVW